MIRHGTSKNFSPEVEPLEERALLSGVQLQPNMHAHRHTAGRGGALVFEVTLAPLNDSGVTGSGTVRKVGDKLRVNLEINGLTPDVVHQMHIHGFGDPKLNTAPEWDLGPQDRPSQVPTPADMNIVPKTPDQMPGLVSEHQAEVVSGPEMVDLTIGNDTTIYPAADAGGHISYHQTLDASTPTGADVKRLGWRVIEVHGAFVSDEGGTNHVVQVTNPLAPPAGATYDDLLPVAGGHLVPVAIGTSHRAHHGHRR